MPSRRPTCLRFAEVAEGLPGRHLARIETSELPTSAPRHTHDFAEVFWVEAGRVRHQTSAGRRVLHAGDVVFVRPEHVHAVDAAWGDGRFVNLAFPAETLDAFAGRYYRGVGNWPWGATGTEPRVLHTPAETIDTLSRLADELAACTEGQLATEAFLLTLLREVAPPTRPAVPPECPTWLADALERLGQPEHLPRGREELVRLAGRSPEHVNRTVRAVFGCTATDLANDIRLAAAARMLRMTGRDILDIALDCGFGNLGYFYRQFAARYHQPPRRYRQAQRRTVLPRVP